MHPRTPRHSASWQTGQLQSKFRAVGFDSLCLSVFLSGLGPGSVPELWLPGGAARIRHQPGEAPGQLKQAAGRLSHCSMGKWQALDSPLLASCWSWPEPAMVHGEAGAWAPLCWAEELVGIGQLWDEPRPRRGASGLRPHCRASPGAAQEMWAGDRVRGYECTQASPPLCVSCCKTSLLCCLACFVDSSGKTCPSVRIGVTSPTACAALIKWLRSRGFDLFLK